ncbi:MAG: hypothetical protein C0501_19730 [Isosphaera sp.]|nr:hypothetical protein [Isosphaera sp.]
MARGLRPAGLFVVALVAAGCAGPTHVPVAGSVVWADGAPAVELAGGAVEFESADRLRSARGEIGPDATFSLSTSTPGDGVPPGEYLVVVVPPPPPGEAPSRLIDPRFCKFDTSGLTHTVRPEPNTGVVLRVARFGR